MEQIPGVTWRHGRWSERLRSTLEKIGLALAGRAGARMCDVLGLRASRSTLLRLVCALPDLSPLAPVAVGIDDYALRKVIWSRPQGVLDVGHESLRCLGLRGGGGYLPPSIT